MNTATSIALPTFTFSNNIVSSISAFTINFQYPIPTELSCFIEIVFPTDFPIDQSRISSYEGTGFFNNDGTADNSLDSSYISWTG